MEDRRKEDGWCWRGGEKEGGGVMLTWRIEGRRRADVGVVERRKEEE